MIDSTKLNDLVKNLINAIPPGATQLPKELEQTFHEVLQNTLTKMNLVTREEFDAQTKVLQRTRQKLEQLEKQVKTLEDTQ